MNVDNFSEAFGNIDERYIRRAMEYKPRNIKRLLYRAAAFFALLLAVSALETDILKGLGGPGQEDVLRPPDVIEYGGAYYKAVDMTDKTLLEKFNLPYEISPEMLGVNLGSGYGADGEALGNLYVYAPYSEITTADHRVCRSVYINEEDGEYSYVLFCSYVKFDTNTHMEFSELLNIYGIDEAADISEIKIGDTSYSDKEDISGLYDILINSYSMGNDDFHAITDVSTDESGHMGITAVEISIVSVYGVTAHNIRYYPTINFISWAQSYYEPREQIVR